MALTPLCLRLEATGGRPIEEYRIHEKDVQVRRLQSRTQNGPNWRRLMAEELTDHVYRNSMVAQWLEYRMGWQGLLLSCVGDQNLTTKSVEDTVAQPS